MNSRFDIVEHTKEDWRELGFYYSFEKEEKTWLLQGSAQGLSNLGRELREFATGGQYTELGDHEHLGPYMYLTVITSEEPQITDYGLFGSKDDLIRLSEIIEVRLKRSKVGDIVIIDSEYSITNEAVLRMEIKEDGFDPTRADDFAWAKK